jgi:hypothetical protein
MDATWYLTSSGALGLRSSRFEDRSAKRLRTSSNCADQLGGLLFWISKLRIGLGEPAFAQSRFVTVVSSPQQE